MRHSITVKIPLNREEDEALTYITYEETGHFIHSLIQMPYQRPDFNNVNNDNHSNICLFLQLYMYVFFDNIFLPQNHRSAFVIYFLIGGKIAHFDSDTMTFFKGLTIMIAHHYYKHSRWTCTHRIATAASKAQQHWFSLKSYRSSVHLWPPAIRNIYLLTNRGYPFVGWDGDS